MNLKTAGTPLFLLLFGVILLWAAITGRLGALIAAVVDPSSLVVS